MKRGAPLSASSGPARSSRPPRRRTPVRAVSTRKRAQRDERIALCSWLAGFDVRCEIGAALLRHRLIEPGACAGRMQGLHERRKRSSQGSVNAARNLIPACNPCNTAIETIGDDLLRAIFGSWLVLRERDPEWADVGPDAPVERPTVDLCLDCGQAHVTVSADGHLPCGHRIDDRYGPA